MDKAMEAAGLAYDEASAKFDPDVTPAARKRGALQAAIAAWLEVKKADGFQMVSRQQLEDALTPVANLLADALRSVKQYFAETEVTDETLPALVRLNDRIDEINAALAAIKAGPDAGHGGGDE